VIVAEAQTLIYASRATNPGQVRIFRIKNSIPVAAIKAYRIPAVLQLLRPAYPQFVAGDNVFKTSFDNIGAVFHPALTVLNAGWIEDDADFQFYIEGCTPSVARVLERLDAERVAVAEAVGFRAMTARQWLYFADARRGVRTSRCPRIARQPARSWAGGDRRARRRVPGHRSTERRRTHRR